METGKVLIYLKNKNRGLTSIDGKAETALLQNINFEVKSGDEIVFDLVKSDKGLIAEDVSLQSFH